MADENAQSIQSGTVPVTEGPRPADIELATTQSVTKTDHDPFLVAFEEPFDAENPRSVMLYLRKSSESN